MSRIERFRDQAMQAYNWSTREHTEEMVGIVRKLLDVHPASKLAKHLAASKYWWDHLGHRQVKHRIDALDPYIKPMQLPNGTKYPLDEIIDVFTDCFFKTRAQAIAILNINNQKAWANLVLRTNLSSGGMRQ